MKKVIHYKKFIGESDFLSLDDEKYKYVIVSGTGSGKTSYILEKLKRENRPFIFLVDTIALGLNLSKKFDIPFHYSGNKVHIGYPQVITLYNHLGAFYSEENLDRVVIIDEIHSLITARRYRKEHILELIAELSYYDKIIGLTGTFIHSQWFDNFTILQCENNKGKQTITIVRYSNAVSKAAEITQKALNDGKQVFIYIQSKSISGEYGKLITTLKENGIEKISVLNSETIKDEFEFEGAKEIVEDERFEAEVLISTYSQGYSLKNPAVVYICFPEINYIDIIQSIARLRKTPSSINILNNARNGQGNFLFETERRFVQILSSCREEQKNANTVMKSEKHFERIIERKAVGRYFSNSYTIDTNLIALDVTQSLSYDMQDNLGLLESMLDYYGFVITSSENDKPNDITLATIDKSVKEQKQERIKQQCSVMFTLIENGMQLPAAIQPLFQKYQELCEVMPKEEAQAFMTETYPTATRQTVEETYLRACFNAPSKVEYRHLKHLALDYFQPGKSYFTEEIKEVMQTFAKESEVTIKNSKEVMTLGCIVEIKETTKREDNKIIHGFKVL